MMSKRQTLLALIRLSRYQDYLMFVTIITLFGFIFSNALLTKANLLTLAIVLSANLLAVCFSFMINDVEDAEDDALNPDKKHRNPVSAGKLSRKRAFVACIGIGIMSAGLYIQLPFISAVSGIATLIIGALYSWKWIRLKNIPLLDIVSHSLMLGGLLYITAYFSFPDASSQIVNWLIPLLFVVCTSAYGELANEVRDFTYDKQAGLQHTAVFIGKSLAQHLMYTFLGLAIVIVLFSTVIGLVPLFIIIAITMVSGIFSLPSLLSIRNPFLTTNLTESVYWGTTITLLFWILLRSL